MNAGSLDCFPGKVVLHPEASRSKQGVWMFDFGQNYYPKKIMDHRHLNRRKYFEEQAQHTLEYIIPYLTPLINFSPQLSVCEIGCGEGGNLKPFLDNGCKVTGIDISVNKIENALVFFHQHQRIENLSLFALDVNKIQPDRTGLFDLIILRDTLEHLPDHVNTLQHIKSFLKPTGKLFIGFPPWRMPFGGHQQMCKSKVLSKMPYVHLLPASLYYSVLHLFGESKEKIEAFREIRDTRISIRKFKKVVRQVKFTIEAEDYFLINPNYKVKFNLNPRKLPLAMNIPYVRDFYVTTCYFIVGSNCN